MARRKVLHIQKQCSWKDGKEKLLSKEMVEMTRDNDFYYKEFNDDDDNNDDNTNTTTTTSTATTFAIVQCPVLFIWF
jgi:hypothetical protein